MKNFAWRSLLYYPQMICAIGFLSASSLSIPTSVQSKSSSFYGLGIPVRNSSLQIFRCGDYKNLVSVNLLAPDDGATTLSSHPTFYWYIEHKSLVNIPQAIPEDENVFYVDFILREGSERTAKSIFRTRNSHRENIKAHSGLYKFTLPTNSPPLEVGKTYTWQIRYIQNSTDKNNYDGSGQINTVTFVKRVGNPSVMQQIDVASSELIKARIFAKNAYWYDALDSYTKWIDLNPNDNAALKERLTMLDQIMDRDPKIKCATKYNINNSSLVNGKKPIQQIMRY